MLCSGLFGGTVNFFQLYSDQNKGWINYWRCVIVGLGAAFLVPLFLQMISSNLVDNVKTSDKDLLVFIGFCLIAAIFSRRFIETIGEKILKQVEQVKETAEQAKEIAQTSKEEVEILSSKSTEVDETSPVSPDSVVAVDSSLPNQSGEGKTMLKKDWSASITKVLRALKDNLYTFRTLKGIAKDADISEKQAEIVIKALAKRGWIKEFEKDQKKLFVLTESGKTIVITNEE
jgi:predicted transcriptional regulator